MPTRSVVNVFFLLGISFTSGNAQTTGACRYTGWRPPASIPVSEPTTIRFTDVVERGSRQYMVSVPFALPISSGNVHSSNAGATPLNVQTLSGTKLASPSGTFVFSYPRAAIDSRGDLHVVWGEPDSAPPRWSVESRGDIPVTSLWHSVWRNHAWSVPRRIYRAKQIIWDPITTSRLLADSKGGLRIALTASEPKGQQEAIYLAYDGADWRSTRVKNATPVVYADLALGEGNSVALAFVAAPPARGFGVWRENGLFVITSTDGGSHWSSPASVATDERMPAYEPHIFFGARRTIDIVWTQAGKQSGATLWHTASDDGGRTWRGATALVSTHPISKTQAIIDSCGSIHTAAQVMTTRGPHIGYARFTDGRWTPLNILFSDQLGAQPKLWLSAIGRPKLSFYQAPPTANTQQLFRLKLTELLAH